MNENPHINKKAKFNYNTFEKYHINESETENKIQEKIIKKVIIFKCFYQLEILNFYKDFNFKILIFK